MKNNIESFICNNCEAGVTCISELVRVGFTKEEIQEAIDKGIIIKIAEEVFEINERR